MDRCAPRSSRSRCTAVALMLALGLPATAIAASPPLQLLGFDTIGSETPDFSAPLGPVRVPVTALRLRFSVAPVALASDFQLLRAGAHPIAATGCGEDPGDASPVPIETLSASADGTEITLALQTGTGLDAGQYRLILCNTLPGLGTALVRDFEVGRGSLLDNPGFNADLHGWTVVPLLPAGTLSADWTPEDADAADGSGALRIHSALNGGVTIASQRCIEAPPAPGRFRFRYRVLEGAAHVSVSLRFGFAGDLGEPDCLGPHGALELPAPGYAFPSDSWTTYDTELLPYFWAPRQMLALHLFLQRGAASATTILIDDVGYSINPDDGIFITGFEDATH